MRSSGRLPLLAAAASLTLSACGGDSTEVAAWCRQGPGSDSAVANASEGLWEQGGQRAELRELWRAGGLNEGEGLAFPIGISPGPEGRIAVPDFRLGEVFVVGADGEWLGSWTRTGRGPGEVQAPVAASWTEEGRLTVFDVVSAKVLWLDASGDVAREAGLDPSFTAPVVSSGSLVKAAVSPDGTAWLQPSRTPISGEARAVDRLIRRRPGAPATDTVRVDTIATLTTGGPLSVMPLPGTPTLVFALGPEGGLVLGDPGGRYRIVARDRELAPERAICGSAAPEPPPTPEARGDTVSDRERELSEAIVAAPRPDSLAAFDRFFVGARGRLWVQRDRYDPLDTGAFWGAAGSEHDVFSSDGRYLGSVTAPEGARLQAARGDTIWALEFGELDEAWIVAYRLELSG